MPVVADLASMRAAMVARKGDAVKVNPLQPVDLVIDHSVQVDYYGTKDAFAKNLAMEFQRNGERYSFLKWGQKAFRNFQVVPPGQGICHQVNIEYLAHVAMLGEMNGKTYVYPDTLVGTDSHTPMVNALGVVGWGVGGIEAEAAMLGQPCTMLIPQVVGFELTGALPAGATATDLVLTVTQMLRKKGVVGKFVEYFGPGVATLTVADRATIANMAPEYGATIGIFPVDQKTIEYLRITGREERAERAEAYYRAQGLFVETPSKNVRLFRRADAGSGFGRAVDGGPVEAARPLGVVEGAQFVPTILDHPLRRGAEAPGRRGGRVDRRFGAAEGEEHRAGRPAPRRRVWSLGQNRGGHRRSVGREVQSGARVGGDRRDHLVHQHLEPRPDGGRGDSGAQTPPSAG